MRVGVTLPSMGHLSQPDNLIQATKAAERLGYDTLWVADRLLYPIKPRTKYPVTADGSLPQVYKRVLILSIPSPLSPRTRRGSAWARASSTFPFTTRSLSRAD